jgi:GWxTD domain-containing protein
MTALVEAVQTPLANALGWTLFHSLWEGALAALALACALFASHSPRVRYWAACVAMAAMLAGAGFTFARVMPEKIAADAAVTHPVKRAFRGRRPLPADVPARFRAADAPPWFTPFWVAGVTLFHLRTLASCMAARRMRRRGVCLAPGPWQQRLARLGASVRVAKPVVLLESCLAEAPAVIGYLRPVILVPVGMLAGMPAGQVEGILLHELAHIRRHDYLVNLLQTVVEGFLFYHPAVWWISSTIRAEREKCCDDLAVAARGDAHEYATALAALEQNRRAANKVALAATGGNLMKRIRRLLYPLEAQGTALTPVLSAGILTLTAAVALTAWQTKPANPDIRPVAQAGEHVGPYDRWLREDVAYIVTDRERFAFQGLTTDEERDKFIEQFWLRRDPTPNTVENEFQEEHYRRIAYANEHYASGSGVAGWKTDRGRIYITFGPPDEIESHPSGGKYQRPAQEGGGEISTYPFEEWRYRHVDGVGENVVLPFVDKRRTGEFQMSRDPRDKEVK